MRNRCLYGVACGDDGKPLGITGEADKWRVSVVTVNHGGGRIRYERKSC
jgi:hypothetical protein